MDNQYRLSAQQAIDIARSFPEQDQNGEQCIVGIVPQEELRDFLAWMCSPEAQEIHRKLLDQDGE